MERMCRTQIYLPADLIAGLDRLARQRGTSRANLIRLAAQEFLTREEDNGDRPILGLIGLGTAGPGRTSEEHDKVLAEYILSTHSK